MKVFESKFTKEELNSINEVIKTGQLGFGPNVLKFELQFQSFSIKNITQQLTQLALQLL